MLGSLGTVAEKEQHGGDQSSGEKRLGRWFELPRALDAGMRQPSPRTPTTVPRGLVTHVVNAVNLGTRIITTTNTDVRDFTLHCT